MNTVNVVALLVLISIAAADLGCQNVWTGPSKDNDLGECITDSENLQRKDNQSKLILIVFPILWLIPMLFFFPVFWIGREICGCCGSSNPRPGAGCMCKGSEWDSQDDSYIFNAYPLSRRRRMVFLAWLLFICGFIAAVLMFTSGGLVHVSYNSFFEGLHEVVDWMESKAVQITNDLTIDGELVPGIDTKVFDDIKTGADDYREDINDLKKDTDEYEGNVQIGINIMAAMGIVVPLIMPLYAACSIRRCLPACTTCLYFFLFIVACLLATVLFLLSALLKDFNDEIELHKARQPGLFQWYLIPVCEDAASFEDIESKLDASEKENSIKACQDLLGLCSPSADYDENDPDVIFQCGITNPTTQCETAADVRIFFDGAALKAGLPEGKCQDLPNSECTMRICGDRCLDSKAKSQAKQAGDGLDYAEAVIKALRRIIPLLDCDLLLTQFLVVPLVELPKLRDACFLLASGLTVGFLILAMGIGVLFKGQKLFFTPPENEGSTPQVVYIQQAPSTTPREQENLPHQPTPA